MCIEIVTADLPNFNITKYLITSLHPPVPIFAVLSTTVSALVEYDFEKKKYSLIFILKFQINMCSLSADYPCEFMALCYFCPFSYI